VSPLDRHEALAGRLGATPAELQEALTALPEVFRVMVDGLREAAQSGAVREMTEPLLAVLREMPPEDREAVAALLLLSGNASGVGLRIAAVPTDEIVRAMWGSDPACTSFEEIVAELFRSGSTTNTAVAAAGAAR
jgi:hypothetical protein